MILRPQPTFRDVLFTLKGSIAKQIAVQLSAITLVACGVTLLATRHPELFGKLSAMPFTLIGLALSIFMSFRNSACYDRWWEGRKQWGQLIVEVRCLLRESNAFAEDPARVPMLRAIVGFSHALAARLRGEDERTAAAPWMSPAYATVDMPNLTDLALVEVGRHCQDLAARQVISEWRYTILDTRLVSMSGVHTACERIKGAPVPFAYTLLLHRTAYMFCCLLPFGLAGPLGLGDAARDGDRQLHVLRPRCARRRVGGSRSAASPTTCRSTPWCASSSARPWRRWASATCRLRWCQRPSCSPRRHTRDIRTKTRKKIPDVHFADASVSGMTRL